MMELLRSIEPRSLDAPSSEKPPIEPDDAAGIGFEPRFFCSSRTFSRFERAFAKSGRVRIALHTPRRRVADARGH